MYYFLIIFITDCTKGLEMLNSINPPHGCTSYGYCYPSDRSISESGEITCKGGCICPSDTIKVDQLNCDGGEKCTPTSCPNDIYYDCRTTSTKPKCVCKPGFTGSDCEIPINSPCAATPCLNRGLCSTDAKNTSYTCTCDPGFSGDQCQCKSQTTAITCDLDEGNPCLDKTCRNGGTCQVLGNSKTATCKCPFQFYGDDCGTARQVNRKYVDCFDDSSFDYSSPDYFLYSSSASTGPDCFSQLIQYRTANVDATYNIATLGTGNLCYFSDSNMLKKKPSCFLFMCKSCESGTPKSGQAPVYELVGTKISPCSDKSCGVGTCAETKDSMGWYCQCPNGQRKKEECVLARAQDIRGSSLSYKLNI
uniref:EGF-like domain-containing protein n=1 Tax=Heterorhabditis bacteriophora TaxID=37862 RepID=A0A1I7XKZ3_HETBA